MVLPMGTFRLAVLGRLPRIDEVVDDALFLAESIEGMDSFYRHIAAFVGTNVVVSEDRSVVRLHRPDTARKSPDDRSEKII